MERFLHITFIVLMIFWTLMTAGYLIYLTFFVNSDLYVERVVRSRGTASPVV